MVSITYGHAYLEDGDSVTGWTEDAGLGGNGTFTSIYGDVFDVQNTGGAVDYFLDNDADIATSITTWPYLLLRYKTDSSGVKAQVIVEFDDATTQTVLAESASTSYTVVAATLTSATATELDHIRFYANDVAGHVYYDFALVCKAPFTFPSNFTRGPIYRFPPDYAKLAVPGRVGRVTQNLGSDLASVEFQCDLDQGTWSRTGDVIDTDVFEELAHETSSEPWNWLTTGRWNVKATLEQPELDYTGGRRLASFTFTEKRMSDAANETYWERFGLGL